MTKQISSHAHNIEVSILIVCYQSKYDITACLKSIYQHVTCVFEILLIDNSNDGTFEYICENFNQVKTFENDKNLGFSRANNFLASKAKGKYLLLLNPDTYMEFDAVSPLLKAAYNLPNSEIWGGLTFYPNGDPEPSSKQYLPTLRNELLTLFGLKALIKINRPLNGQYSTNEIVSGAFMLTSRQSWDHLSGLDASFFLYSEEVDYCLRSSQHNGTLPIVVPEARIIHCEGHSSDDADRIVLTFRGKMQLVRKYQNIFYVIAMFFILWNYVISRVMLGIILGKTRGMEKRQAYLKAALNPLSWCLGRSKSGVSLNGAK